MTLKLGRYMPLVRCIGVWFSVRWICLSSAACCSLQYTCGSGELSGGAISALLAKKWAKTSGHCRVQQKEGTEQNTARNRISGRSEGFERKVRNSSTSQQQLKGSLPRKQVKLRKFSSNYLTKTSGKDLPARKQ